jgi:hypothetical protein
MMKRIAFLLIFLMGISLIQAAPTVVKKKTKALKFDSTFSVALGAGARNFLGDEEDVYGFANLLFFLDAGFRFNKNFEVFVHGEYLQAKGELTITKEETTLRIIPAEAGGRFLFGNHPFLGYLGGRLFHQRRKSNRNRQQEWYRHFCRRRFPVLFCQKSVL